MADSGNVRLVRCPKCENLLPELADYSVYLCGGCGAVLRAKKKNPDDDTLSEKSDEEKKVEKISEKSENLSEKRISDNPQNLSGNENLNLTDVSELDIKSNNFFLDDETKEVATVGLEGEEVSRLGKDIGYFEKYMDHSWVTSEMLAGENGQDLNTNRYEQSEINTGIQIEKMKSLMGNEGNSWRSRHISDLQNVGRAETTSFQRKPSEHMNISDSNFVKKDSSKCHLDSNFGVHHSPLKNCNDLDGSSRVECLEHDRAELIRKLDELKDQLSRSCNVAEKPQEKVPLDGRTVHPDCWGGSNVLPIDGSSKSNKSSMQFLIPDRHVAPSPYCNHCSEPYPYPNRQGPGSHGSYPSPRVPTDILAQPLGPQMMRRTSHEPPTRYQHQLPYPYLSGRYVDRDHDMFETYSRNELFHQSACSCLGCNERHRRVKPSALPSAFANKRYTNVLSDPLIFHHENCSAFGGQLYNPKLANPPLGFHNRAQMRWPGNLDSELDDFVHCPPPPRVVMASDGRVFRPISSGAPFITCHNCFELLQLPKKVLSPEKNKRRIRCGACSTVMHFTVVDKKITVSIHGETKPTSSLVDCSTREVVGEAGLHGHGHVVRASTHFHSDDSDNLGYDFHSSGREPIISSTDQDINSSKSQEAQSIHSLSPVTSDDEDCHKELTGVRTNAADQLKNDITSPPPPGSPLQEDFANSSNNHAANRFGKGNRSSRSDHDKVVPNKVTLHQKSMKEASLATEVEVSFKEYSNTGVSQDSGDGRMDTDRLNYNKGGESFFAGIIKKSLRDFSRSNQTADNGKTNVSINGRSIPDRVIKKAEKLAGPIHPGHYWYDFRGGFWGVMGGPCLGIIPPFIEEFNYPMPEKCAGGNTGVLVNGRELHQKDLDLLSSRGLPTVRDGSYIIEISGRVVDDASGEELDSLGKLAPTVERVKHGFGMKAPRTAVS